MKLYAMTMAYNREFLIRRSLEFFYETVANKDVQHIFCDQYYPLPTPGIAHQKFDHIARHYGLRQANFGKNLGYHETQNEVLKQFPEISDEDILLNYDPDSMPLTYGWDAAILKAFNNDPHLVVVGLVNQVIETELSERGFNEHIYDGLRVRYPHRAGVMSIIAWRAGFIRKVGGLKEPRSLYGGVEAAMWPIIQEHGARWGYLPDYHESPDLARYADPEYTEWKRLHGHEATWAGDFDSYLRHIGRMK